MNNEHYITIQQSVLNAWQWEPGWRRHLSVVWLQIRMNKILITYVITRITVLWREISHFTRGAGCVPLELAIIRNEVYGLWLTWSDEEAFLSFHGTWWSLLEEFLVVEEASSSVLLEGASKPWRSILIEQKKVFIPITWLSRPPLGVKTLSTVSPVILWKIAFVSASQKTLFSFI